MKHILVAFLLIGLCACARTQGRVPPVTPFGTMPPSISVSDRAVRVRIMPNMDLSFDRPSGWRTITSEAASPFRVTFVAPGDCSLIVVSLDSIDFPVLSDICDVLDVRTVEQAVPLGDRTVTVTGVNLTDDLVDLFVQVADSIRQGSD